MFKSYNSNQFNLNINNQIKKQEIQYWKYKFNKKWQLPIIYENTILYEFIIIDNYF